MPNPNEYDDDAFLEASNGFQGSVTQSIDKLWAAGASMEDIQGEWENALENSDAVE